MCRVARWSGRAVWGCSVVRVATCRLCGLRGLRIGVLWWRVRRISVLSICERCGTMRIE